MALQPMKTEAPCLNNVVGKLDELANRMRSKDFRFNDDDIVNIDKVIEALHELDNDKKGIQDQLETETIKASVLRHRLLFLPSQIKEEIMESVNSARQLNISSQVDLQGQLETINTNIVYLGNRQQQLEKENFSLQPEKEQIRQQHEEIISQLNQRMAEKASMQIALNETRDKVREANKDIVELEDSILQLKEDLIQERTEARQEKKRLKKAVTTTSEKTKEQKEQNLGKKRELDGLMEQLTESELKIETVRKSIRRYEGSRSRLEDQERTLQQAFSHQQKIKAEILRQHMLIVAEKEYTEKEYVQNEENFLAKMNKLKDNIEKATELNYELEIRKEALRHEVKSKEEIKLEDSQKIQEQDSILQQVKDELTEKAEAVGDMHQDIIDMEEQMELLAESHKSVIDQLSKQVEECQKALEKERKERMDIQSKKDGVQKNLEETKAEEQLFMQSVNQEIQAGKTKHVELSNEGSKLQKELKSDETAIQSLQENLKEVKQEYTQMFTDMQEKTKALETEILALETHKERNEKLLEEKGPEFEKMEVNFQERTAEYSAVKKNVVSLKNQKTDLENTIKKTKNDLQKLVEPLGNIQNDIKHKRIEALDQLKQLGKEMEEIENSIFVEGSKLKTVLQKNDEFEKNIKKWEKEIKELELQMAQNELIKVKLENQITDEKDNLVKSWLEDQKMQQIFAELDELSVKEFGQILEKTECRAHLIGDITSNLQTELAMLSTFLETLATRRPAETPRSSRKQSSRRTLTAVDAVAEANRVLGHTPRPPTSRSSKSRLQLRAPSRASISPSH
ncbi:myosin heavy chain, non-muscle-like [Gigantopelta aegis]|uniref:myosin heavy chain, non-muscle-like n=1 Tax=Gigantopelta aegis TaxID=1735272 RepID=UPI001B889945|nr:myosin heavy chain, non-muscle-like [Gigantopelta aegis]